MRHFVVVCMVLVFFISPLKAILESLSLMTLQQGDNKKSVEVLIMGDGHVAGSAKDPLVVQDAQDFLVFKQLLHSWNKLENVACLFESNKFIEKQNQEILHNECTPKEEYYGMHYMLPFYIASSKKELSKITFNASDLRAQGYYLTKNIVTSLLDIFCRLGQGLDQNPQAYLDTDGIQQNIKALVTHTDNQAVSVEAFLNELKSAHKTIGEIYTTKKVDDITHDFLVNQSEALQEGIQKLQDFFEKYSTAKKDISTSEVLVEYLMQEAKLATQNQAKRSVAFTCIDACIDKITEFNTMYEKITNCVADAGFVHSLLEHAKSHDKIALFCGHNHAVTLVAYLKKYQEK